MIPMRAFKNKSRFMLLILAGLLALPAAAFAQPAQQLTSEQVNAAIAKAVAWLRQKQRADGTWPGLGHEGGVTALCTLALLNAGADANDPAVAKGIARLHKIPNHATYTTSLKCQVYAAADPKKYAAQLKAAAEHLINTQRANGMWGYSKSRGRGDNSNAQFALLGLHQAANAGVKVPKRVWQRSSKHFINGQNRDGGWGYMSRGEKSYGSMTAAGIASLYICGQSLAVGRDRTFQDGAYPGCGKYSRNVVLAKGLKWMTKKFSVKRNPNRGSWYYYYLYGLERVGMISGRHAFGSHDWYREGAAELISRQNAAGHWGRGRQMYQTAFAVLFLAKGNRPVLIQKVQWPGHWNRNIHDLKNLTAFIGDKLGKQTTWQTTSLSLPLKELRLSPILLITGHEFPKFTPAEVEKLKAFIEDAGGTILFEACCGSKEFAAGFRAFAKTTWPLHPLRPLQKDHVVFSSVYRIEDTYGLEGLGGGCRTSVFFSPKALSCLWELQTVPKFSNLAFRLGTNLAAYATGKEQLPDRLAVINLPSRDKKATGKRTSEVPRGAIRIARLIHDGDYNADPHAMIRLAELLAKKANIDVVAKSRHLRPSDKSIYEYPVVFMNGHYKFKFSPEDIKGLRAYLKKGGVLIADPCCGRVKFDKSFREMVKTLFPNRKFTLLPKDHPIYTGKTGITLGEVKYRRILAEELKQRGTTRPPIEVLRIDGRAAIIYSKYDWCCALEGDNPFSCRGYIDEDGKKLAMAIFLYAVNY
ncbi:MAG: DUF4159 domain-containing protein [Phycisphaerae bacterium]|nr:DUF4159 domain-containing protein [Phycisphaerae bacterium]